MKWGRKKKCIVYTQKGEKRKERNDAWKIKNPPPPPPPLFSSFFENLVVLVSTPEDELHYFFFFLLKLNSVLLCLFWLEAEDKM